MRDGPSRPGRARARPRPGAPARPTAARPTGRRAAGAGGQTTRTSAPAPPGRFTGRAVVLGVVLFALVLSYIYPVRIYFTQQSEITQLRAAQQVKQERIQELETLAAKWRDDEFVRIQARQRLLMVRPGESLLIVEVPPELDPELDAAGTEPGQPWYHTLWRSIQAANGVEAPE